LKHKVLDVYESSLAHCVDEVSTNPAPAYQPLFVRLAKKQGNDPVVYRLLQSHKSQNTLMYYYSNTVKW